MVLNKSSRIPRKFSARFESKMEIPFEERVLSACLLEENMMRMSDTSAPHPRFSFSRTRKDLSEFWVFFANGDNWKVRIFDLASLQPVKDIVGDGSLSDPSQIFKIIPIIDDTDSVTVIALTRFHEMIAFDARKHTYTIAKLDSSHSKGSADSSSCVLSAVYLPQASHIWTGSSLGTVKVWRISPRGVCEHSKASLSHPIECMALAGEDMWLSGGGNVTVLGTDLTVRKSWRTHYYRPIEMMIWISPSRQMWTLDRCGLLNVWDEKTFEKIDCVHIEQEGGANGSEANSFSILNSGIVTLGQSAAVYMAFPSEVQLYDCSTKELLQRFHVGKEVQRRCLFPMNPHFFHINDIDVGETILFSFTETEMLIWVGGTHISENM